MGLEANMQLQKTSRRLKEENEALRGLLVRLGYANMIQSALDGISGSDDTSYTSQAPVGLTGPGAMDFGGRDNRNTKSKATPQSKRQKVNTPSDDEDEEDEDEEEEEEEVLPKSKATSKGRALQLPINNIKQEDQQWTGKAPHSAPAHKSNFAETNNAYIQSHRTNEKGYNFNDWYPGFNQQVQEEQIKQQQQRQIQEDRQSNKAGSSRSPESSGSGSLTSLSSNSNTPNLPTDQGQQQQQQPHLQRQGDELANLSLSSLRNSNARSSPVIPTVFQSPQINGRLPNSNSTQGTYPSSSSENNMRIDLSTSPNGNGTGSGGAGISGSALLGNNQSNGGFTAPTSQDRPSFLRAWNSGSNDGSNGGNGTGGNMFPFIQPTHQNDALLNPNPIPFAFNLSNTSPPDQSWWNQMGGGMLTPGQDPNGLDEKAMAVAQATGGSAQGASNNSGARDRESQSPFDLSSFLTGGSSPGSNGLGMSGGNPIFGSNDNGGGRYTPTSPFGLGMNRSSSRNSNPFESMGKFLNSSPSPTGSVPPPPSASGNGNFDRSPSFSSNQQTNSSNTIPQSEHAQTFLRLLEKKIASMNSGGNENPYTSLGFQPPMHSRNSSNPRGYKRSDSNSSVNEGADSSQKAALASTVASALAPNGVYSRLAQHPAFLSTNVQELEELVDAIGSDDGSSSGRSNSFSGQDRLPSHQANNRGNEEKDNVALLFGMLDRKKSNSFSSASSGSSRDGNGNHAYGLTSPQLQHHHQLQKHQLEQLQMQQSRRQQQQR